MKCKHQWKHRLIADASQQELFCTLCGAAEDELWEQFKKDEPLDAS